MSISVSVSPNKIAAQKFASKRDVASTMRTRDWETLPQSLRDAAFFSAGVNNAKVLGAIHGKINEALSLARKDPQAVFMSRDKFISSTKDFLRLEGYAMEGESIKNIVSSDRLKLIYDFNTEQSFEAAKFAQGMDSDILESFPAQELFRVESRDKKRDWKIIWLENGGQIFDGRMIALKTDDIWTAISRFGTPYPPFDFNSGMGTRDISRKEAIKLGLLEAFDEIVPNQKFSEIPREADLKNVPPQIAQALKKSLEEQAVHIEFENSKLVLKSKIELRPTWSDYGFESAKSWKNAQIKERLNSVQSAQSAMLAGDKIKTPAGEINYGLDVLNHWDEELAKGAKLPENIDGRYERFDLAKSAASKPMEIWEDNGQYSIINTYKNKAGKVKGISTVTDKESGNVNSYFVGPITDLNKLRHGKRIYNR